jgi:hypothetical protein
MTTNPSQQYGAREMQQTHGIGMQSRQGTVGPGTQMQRQSLHSGGGVQTGQQQSMEMDLPLDEAISNEMSVALYDFVESAKACEWCANRCIDEGPQMAECIRLCRDVADLAVLNVQLLARDSVFGPEAAETFISAAEACASECAQHSHRHCQECAAVLDRAIESTRSMLASFGGGTASSAPVQNGTTAGTQFQPP